MDAELEHWKSKGRWFDYLGFDVFYVVEGTGPHVLLLHGYPFNSFDWAWVWEALRDRFTVIAPDMIGMGFSAKPVRYDYSVLDHASMHEALLEHLGVRECHLLAHDIGDSVAQELLARHERGEQSAEPFGISSITWLNGGLFYEAYRPRPIQTLLSATPLGVVLARYRRVLLSNAVLDRGVAEMFGPRTKPSAKLLEQFHQVMDYNDGRRVTHKVGRFVLDRHRHRNRWVQAMRRTRVPMRMIDGPSDPNSGRHMADRYREVIPDPDVVLLDDHIGHWPQIEDPAAVTRHFLEFVDAASETAC